jgi:hypothetical protein
MNDLCGECDWWAVTRWTMWASLERFTLGMVVRSISYYGVHVAVYCVSVVGIVARLGDTHFDIL